VRIKADGSQVTSADVEVEELIRTLIAARFPGDGVVGEDQGETAGTSGRRWIIDPIDGRKSASTGLICRDCPAAKTSTGMVSRTSSAGRGTFGQTNRRCGSTPPR
jgi:hypothetical protein